MPFQCSHPLNRNSWKKWCSFSAKFIIRQWLLGEIHWLRKEWEFTLPLSFPPHPLPPSSHCCVLLALGACHQPGEGEPELHPLLLPAALAQATALTDAFRLLLQFGSGSSCHAEAVSDSEWCSCALKATLVLPACALPSRYPANLLTHLCPARRLLRVKKMKGLTLSWSLGFVHIPFLPYVLGRQGMSKTFRSQITFHFFSANLPWQWQTHEQMKVGIRTNKYNSRADQSRLTLIQESKSPPSFLN